MMFTYKFFRNPKNGALHLRITYERKKAEMELGIKITEEELKSALEIKPKSRNVGIARTIEGMQTVIRSAQREFFDKGGIPAGMDAKQIREVIRERLFYAAAVKKMKDTEEEEEKGRLFAPFFKKKMDAVANKGYRESYDYTYKKIQAFCEDKDADHGKDFDRLLFDDISLRWLNAFDEWLAGQGAAQNSRNIHFKNIRTVINRAIDEELTDKYPFRRFKIRPEATEKRSLSVKNLRRLFDYPVEEYQKFYVDMFKLIFMLCGINTADLHGLKEIRDGRIEYRRAKTHRLYSIKIEPEAMEIIERWKGESGLLCVADRWSDPSDFNKNMNIALKKIGTRKKLPGRGGKEVIKSSFPGLSTYWARHSWATIAYNDCGISRDVIAQALGHGGNTVTDVYLDKDRKLADDANRKVIDYVLYDNK